MSSNFFEIFFVVTWHISNCLFFFVIFWFFELIDFTPCHVSPSFLLFRAVRVCWHFSAFYGVLHFLCVARANQRYFQPFFPDYVSDFAPFLPAVLVEQWDFPLFFPDYVSDFAHFSHCSSRAAGFFAILLQLRLLFCAFFPANLVERRYFPVFFRLRL